MVPHILRWKVNPQKGETDFEGWFIYFNDTDIIFLQFLLIKKWNKLRALNEEIGIVKDKLGPFRDQKKSINWNLTS